MLLSLLIGVHLCESVAKIIFALGSATSCVPDRASVAGPSPSRDSAKRFREGEPSGETRREMCGSDGALPSPALRQAIRGNQVARRSRKEHISTKPSRISTMNPARRTACARKPILQRP